MENVFLVRKKDTLTVTEPLRLPVISRCKSSTLYARSAIPARSSSVSVGRPIMKYNLTVFHPDLKAFVHAANKSSSLTPFVDNIAHALCTCFRSKSKTTFTYLLHLFRNIDGETINAQGWQAYAHLFIFESSISMSTSSGNLE